MEKRFFSNRAYLRDNYRTRVKYGQKNSVPIDQTPSKIFNVDPATGRPMSDIQRLVKVQNDFTLQSQFAQLQEFKSKFLPEETSDADAIKFMCPRLAQLPSELLEYKNKLASWQLERQQKAQNEKLALEAEKQDREFWDNLKKEIKESKNS